MPPKRRFWTTEQKFRTVFSNKFSMVGRPNGVLTYWKSALKTWSEPWLKHLTNCPKWRLHKKGGLVAYAWMCMSKSKHGHQTSPTRPLFWNEYPHFDFSLIFQPQKHIEILDDNLNGETRFKKERVGDPCGKQHFRDLPTPDGART